MTKAAAIQEFFSSFGLVAFEENTVPTGDDAPDFPYLTYSLTTDSLGAQVPLTCSLWYRDESWVRANAKAEEIGQHIGRGGVFIDIDGGAIWIMRGSPFAQSMGDDSDMMVKRKYINLTAEYWTAD